MAEVWRATRLVDHFVEVNQASDSRRFLFLLGAGASVSSGVPHAGDLATSWLKELFVRATGQFDDAGFNDWLESNPFDIADFDPQNAARSYPEIFRARFDAPEEGFAYLAEQIVEKTPSIGYWALTELMLRCRRHNLVVTTNFDDLVADAFLRYQNRKAVVIGHESLASKVRDHDMRPVVAKLHRDVFFEPINHPDKVNFLHENWSATLRTVLTCYSPIVVGYGGNDLGLMSFLKSLDTGAIPGGVFWCARSSLHVRQEIIEFIEKQNGKLVEIVGFDELMVQLADKTGCRTLPESFKSRLSDLAQQSAAEYTHIRKTLSTITSDDSTPIHSGLIKSLERIMTPKGAQTDWWYWQQKAMVESDFKERCNIYEQAIALLPSSHELRANYGVDLILHRADPEIIESHLKTAVELAPEISPNLYTYGNFLVKVLNRAADAKTYYEAAIAHCPDFFPALLELGKLLFEHPSERDYARAEEFIVQALNIEPGNVIACATYIRFLKVAGFPPKSPGELFSQTSVSRMPYADGLGNYAVFCCFDLRDELTSRRAFDEAFKVYANHPNNLTNYALALESWKEDRDKIIRTHEAALSLAPDDANCFVNYGAFLIKIGRESDGLRKIQEASLRLDMRRISSTHIECHMYLYCLGDERQRNESLFVLKALVARKIRTFRWDFSCAIRHAIRRKHSELRWLDQLALVLTGKSDVLSLRDWQAWKDAN